ncbi:DUF485 domain-containing protein [Anditalea andensis]|uniref:Uncharacterized protein n=1 Tax=Anditalea andensis TaxID=1048983 RepID=A0A074KWL1_9BACT|nr:hypothetical protein [Anditalea andensis]KEO73334.1 hypothetical protein EL17_13385 [Anditalea andensis]
MKQINTIFQLLVAVFFAIALIFFLAFDTIKDTLGIRELTAGTVVVWILVGLVLYLISWALDNVYINGLKKDIRRLELDKNELKAKLYDIEQGSKISTSAERPTEKLRDRNDSLADEKESSKIKPRQNYK